MKEYVKSFYEANKCQLKLFLIFVILMFMLSLVLSAAKYCGGL